MSFLAIFNSRDDITAENLRSEYQRSPSTFAIIIGLLLVSKHSVSLAKSALDKRNTIYGHCVYESSGIIIAVLDLVFVATLIWVICFLSSGWSWCFPILALFEWFSLALYGLQQRIYSFGLFIKRVNP
ncbi:hypothetical protein M422DRAFT_53018 [Sphaerobolus stellatus SS14]|uniref:Uncharacterized protein n=1 Tax=Sphaerobolus stellatus (strain SS14) TaxID=990650 RepID=A0A0C9V3X0_SPHS4|nr:hypothetical protein M422DRAFT_53018 [Sphaerobolus stellatus SS14]